MELVRASQGFHHLPSLQVIQADSTAVLLLFRAHGRLLLLLELEAGNRVDDVLDLLRRWQRHSVLVELLGILIVILIVLIVLLLEIRVEILLPIAAIEEKLLLLAPTSSI